MLGGHKGAVGKPGAAVQGDGPAQPVAADRGGDPGGTLSRTGILSGQGPRHHH